MFLTRNAAKTLVERCVQLQRKYPMSHIRQEHLSLAYKRRRIRKKLVSVRETSTNRSVEELDKEYQAIQMKLITGIKMSKRILFMDESSVTFKKF